MKKIPAKILVVDDDPDVLTAARVVLRQRYEYVETEANPNRISTLIQHNHYDVILLDMNFSTGRLSGNEGLYWLKQILTIQPRQQIIMITAYGDIKLAVETMKHGAADFIVKPWDNEKLEATVYASFQHALARTEIQQLKKKHSQYSQIVSEPESGIIGNSSSIRAVLKTMEKVAPTDANVLLLGENGTGKELMAKLIHQRSSRRGERFVKVDVGSLSANLFESELFGHRKGAFTDAKEDRIGRMELASSGTLFLDEVGNLPLALQVKLLSVLQNREVTPLGSNRPVPINVRLICATNLNLQDTVNNGQFREDLLYRINTVEITLPPLRARQEDIPVLAKYFLELFEGKYRKEHKNISDDALKHLQKYSWPGNVRELQHTVERAVIMSDSVELTRNDFLLSPRKEMAEKKDAFNLNAMERRAILNAIQKYHGNLSKVAKELGVGRTTLYRKMTRFGLEK